MSDFDPFDDASSSNNQHNTISDEPNAFEDNTTSNTHEEGKFHDSDEPIALGEPTTNDDDNNANAAEPAVDEPIEDDPFASVDGGSAIGQSAPAPVFDSFSNASQPPISLDEETPLRFAYY